MVKVLFVCLGNICRSPLAEAIFQKLIEEHQLTDRISCDSCGNSNYHIGGQPDQRTVKNALQNGVVLNHKARQFSSDDFNKFDFIIPMDKSNLSNILKFEEANTTKATIQLMRDYEDEGECMDVPDPYFGGEDGFQEMFDILDRSCKKMMTSMINDQNNGVL